MFLYTATYLMFSAEYNLCRKDALRFTSCSLKESCSIQISVSHEMNSPLLRGEVSLPFFLSPPFIKYRRQMQMWCAQ